MFSVIADIYLYRVDAEKNPVDFSCKYRIMRTFFCSGLDREKILQNVPGNTEITQVFFCPGKYYYELRIFSVFFIVMI